MKLHSFILTALLASHAWASPGHHKTVEMPKDFDRLKELVGTWEGTSVMEGKEEKVTVTYVLTSGGTTVMETLMPGTPHEMVSLYHKDGKTLGMTHYCALGNQPHMTLTKTEPKTMHFEMKKPTGLDSVKDPHMHALTLTWGDAGTLKQEWTHFEGGKKTGTAVFNYSRKGT